MPGTLQPWGGYRDRIGLSARSGASHSQGHDQRRPHTAGHQGHSPGKALEAGDGLDAGLDGPGPVGHSGGPGDAHRPAVRHRQEDAAVIPAVLPLQTLQHALVAQGLPVVVRLVKGQPQKGIAPVETAEGGGEPPSPQVPVLQVEEFVQDDRLVRLPTHRQDQSGSKKSRQEGTSLPAALHHPPGAGQLVPLGHSVDGRPPGALHRDAPGDPEG